MRPIRRNAAPQNRDYTDYTDAKPDLISRFSKGEFGGLHVGSYCSYCERKIETSLAVEHIEPKDGPDGKPALKGRWDNFLLACVNCNSTKGRKKVDFTELFFPDRDNTFYAFIYQADGTIIPNPSLTQDQILIAEITLQLTGLEKPVRETLDANGKTIALDRSSQRIQAWGQAESALDDFSTDPQSTAIKNFVVKNMLNCGFFSIWMAVFKDHPEMRNRFIDAISGTRQSGCFHPVSTGPVCPHPNDDKLIGGGKV